jgi:hypothetical protein
MNLASSYQIHSLIMSLDRTILEEPIMATLRVFLSDEEMRRLEELSKREGLTVEQVGPTWHQ